MAGLAKSSYGPGGELIKGGHLSDAVEYRELLLMFKQASKKNDMTPAATMALEEAARLQARGIPSDSIAFEQKLKNGLDLDVAVLKKDATPRYGAQLKDVTNIDGIDSAVRKAVKQLVADGVDIKVAILDVHQPISAMGEDIIRLVERASRRAKATFQIRFNDGSITIPAEGQVYP